MAPQLNVFVILDFFTKILTVLLAIDYFFWAENTVSETEKKWHFSFDQ